LINKWDLKISSKKKEIIKMAKSPIEYIYIYIYIYISFKKKHKKLNSLSICQWCLETFLSENYIQEFTNNLAKLKPTQYYFFCEICDHNANLFKIKKNHFCHLDIKKFMIFTLPFKILHPLHLGLVSWPVRLG